MNETIFLSPREFQLWSYTVSHRQLLLRSVKTHEQSTRIDILFKAVKSISVNSVLKGIKIDESRKQDDTLKSVFGDGVYCEYTIISDNLRGAIIAQSMTVFEDEGEFNEINKNLDPWIDPAGRIRIPKM